MNGCEQVTTPAQLREAILARDYVRVVGGGSKPALSRDATIDLAGLSGIVEYLPDEYTITVRAGTRLADIQAALDEHGQYLPFDPPLSGYGATIGGTVAAGLSGPGRFRYGGVRDFLLGVTLLTGDGRTVHGGGKVVKNAAGFDIPKLMVGSLGRWGVLTELTFKVFPAPRQTSTIQLEAADWEAAVRAAHALAAAPLDLMALELIPPRRLAIRIGGQAQALDRRVERILSMNEVKGMDVAEPLSDEAEFWREAANLIWAAECDAVVRVPLSPQDLVDVEEVLCRERATVRRYGVGGNVLWLAGPQPTIRDILATGVLQQWSALALRGDWNESILNPRPQPVLAERLRPVFDPDDRFLPARGTVSS